MKNFKFLKLISGSFLLAAVTLLATSCNYSIDESDIEGLWTSTDTTIIEGEEFETKENYQFLADNTFQINSSLYDDEGDLFLYLNVGGTYKVENEELIYTLNPDGIDIEFGKYYTRLVDKELIEEMKQGLTESFPHTDKIISLKTENDVTTLVLKDDDGNVTTLIKQ